MSTQTDSVPFFKKSKKSRPTTTRIRSNTPPAPPAPPPTTESSSSKAGPSAQKSQVILPTRKAAGNLLSAGSKRTRREAENADDDPHVSVRWTADNSHLTAALDILAGDEAEELANKRMRKEMADRGEDMDDVEAAPDGEYRGQKAYKSHLVKSKDVPKAMRVGPQRASGSTIRTVTLIDYQPDVCKDYKETGYCGFGDTCKFLHDRGTYMQGWQLDKLADTAKAVAGDQSSDDSDEDVPFACLICRKHFTDPVVTKCGHYYCSACAIKRFAKTPKCLACGGATGGMFNRADKILAKIAKKKKDKQDKKQAAKEEADVYRDTEFEIEGLNEDLGDESDK